MADELRTSFLVAFQASLSVLLVIAYGVTAGQFGILKSSSTKQISSLCVRLFLPALLMTNVGGQLHADTGIRYLPILVWALFYELSSMALGYVLTRIFKLPSWMTPAITFNNTTALPLLLLQSLDTTGILSSLIDSDIDTTSAALSRARSYFLVNAMINDSLIFAVGPRLLDGEEAQDEGKPGDLADQHRAQPHLPSPRIVESENDHPQNEQTQDDGEEAVVDERTSLLPNFVVRAEEAAYKIGSDEGRKGWTYFPRWIQKALGVLYSFMTPPLLGAMTGAIIGLVPPLHKAFFGDPLKGGIFTAWLTDSVKNIGDLFPALNMVSVGVTLSSSLRKMTRGEDSGNVPWLPMILVLTVRFVMWPAISIPLIYVFATRTTLLSTDPMLWFCLMLMPTGPTAMKLTALADVSGSNETERMSISKFLSITYALSPIICFTVVGALKACHAAMSET